MLKAMKFFGSENDQDFADAIQHQGVQLVAVLLLDIK